MAAKFSVYLTPAVMAALPLADSLSGRISRAADRYAAIVQRAAIDERFTRPELELIAHAMDGHWRFQDAIDPTTTQVAAPGLLAISSQGIHEAFGRAIADGVNTAAMDEQHPGVDFSQVLQKLRSLSFADEVALFDWVERFWARIGASGQS